MKKQDQEIKKTVYSKPQLVVFGDLTNLTQSASRNKRNKLDQTWVQQCEATLACYS
jgi:hypothetical protein